MPSSRLVRQTAIGVLALASLAANPAGAQRLEPVRYVVRIPAPETHYIEVQAVYPTSRRPVVELMMAVWTPGSYLVREFARHVEQVRGHDAAGRALRVEKSRKNRWRVHTGGADRVMLTYRVYAHERQARTNWVEDAFALINGAPTYITLVDRGRRPHEVSLELPAAWSTSISSLPLAAAGRQHHYRAPNFDALVDSPIVAGNPAVHEFSVDGIPHALVNLGEAGAWNSERSAADVETIVRSARQLWGALPYDRYLFFNLLTGGEDGIEHGASTVLLTSRWATRTERGYTDWLLLVAHEFFHAWNVKRLRPVELGPFDYENEVYTRSLWVAEGLSDYYSWLLLARAGLASPDGILGEMSAAIRSLQTTPGRLVQPLELASYDAWIKQYRPDENSPNVSISYYTKGSIVGLLLDARIRRLTGGRRSLDDVMRLAYRRFGGPRGFTPAEFRAAASEVAGADLGDFFQHALETTEELDYAELLEWYGLRFAGRDAGAAARPWLGVVTRVDGGRVVVSSVLRGSSGYRSGLSPDDELVAIDGVRLGAEGLDAGLARYQPGEPVSLLVARRDELRSVAVTVEPAPDDRWTLARRPDASREQAERLAAWLGPRRSARR